MAPLFPGLAFNLGSHELGLGTSFPSCSSICGHPNSSSSPETRALCLYAYCRKYDSLPFPGVARPQQTAKPPPFSSAFLTMADFHVSPEITSRVFSRKRRADLAAGLLSVRFSRRSVRCPAHCPSPHQDWPARAAFNGISDICYLHRFHSSHSSSATNKA